MLQRGGVNVIEDPAGCTGATGKIRSVYLHDPDGNFVEVSECL
jgi:hypothetical protein